VFDCSQNYNELVKNNDQEAEALLQAEQKAAKADDLMAHLDDIQSMLSTLKAEKSKADEEAATW
jgi:hypothetical protein